MFELDKAPIEEILQFIPPSHDIDTLFVVSYILAIYFMRCFTSFDQLERQCDMCDL